MRRRVDPWAERAARRVAGAGRPRFALAAVAAPGRKRTDPRALRDQARIPGEGRPRYAWAGARLGGRVVPAEAGPAPRVMAAPEFLVLVLAGQEAPGCIAAAREIAGDGGAVAVLGGDASAGEAGADRVIPCGCDADVPLLAALLEDGTIRHVVLPEVHGGAHLARQLAARTGLRLVPGVERIRDGRVSRRAGAREMSLPLPRLMTVVPEMFAAPATPGEARPLPLELPGTAAEARPARRLLPADPASVALNEAEFILSAGDGVTDWPGFAALGRALGASLGGSRVVCDAGHLPRDRQVGASGTLVTARIYLAMGISGAPQHLQGIAGVGHVVAVNTDLHAQMIRRADLAIIADAQAVMPALIRLLEGK